MTMKTEYDRARVDGKEYAINHFETDNNGGSFRALNMNAPHPIDRTCVLPPLEIIVDVAAATNEHGYTLIRFRFRRPTLSAPLATEA